MRTASARIVQFSGIGRVLRGVAVECAFLQDRAHRDEQREYHRGKAAIAGDLQVAKERRSVAFFVMTGRFLGGLRRLSPDSGVAPRYIPVAIAVPNPLVRRRHDCVIGRPTSSGTRLPGTRIHQSSSVSCTAAAPRFQ